VGEYGAQDVIRSFLHRREDNYNTSLLLLPLPNGPSNPRRRLVFFLEVSAVVTDAIAAVSSSESFMMIDMLEGDSDRFDCDLYFM